MDLARQVADAVEVARRAPAGIRAAGVPLGVQVHRRALAKTKRPYDFLQQAGFTVAGGGRLGLLLTKADPAALGALRNSVLSATGAQNEWDLSAIESVRAWRPLVEAVDVDEESSGLAKVTAMAQQAETISLELFPWIDESTEVEAGVDLGRHLTSIGLEPVGIHPTPGRPCLYVRPNRRFDVASLRDLLGIRSLYPTPRYSTTFSSLPTTGQGAPPLTQPSGALPTPSGDLPVVGVLDSGVSDDLGAWVAGRAGYDLPRDRDPWHGTFVSGLIAASRTLNGQDGRFPGDAARVLDAQVLPKGAIYEHELMERIAEVVENHQAAIPVWNCSFGATAPNELGAYTPFAAFMDGLAEEHSVLFIQAAGNYQGAPIRSWPPTEAMADGLASPAEATRSVTVGSLAHLSGSRVPVGSPASYSRRGPGVAGLVKPDVCHWSGDFDAGGSGSVTGVASLEPGGAVARSVGTSFATPVVSAVAANLVGSLSAPDLQAVRKPALVKGLLVHSARLGRMSIADQHRVYYGHGLPSESADVLADTPDRFTTLYRVRFTTAGEWVKQDLPIPSCLISDGKLKADVCMTVSHDALVDGAYDAECVRTAVQASVGPQSVGKKGRINVQGKVPSDSELAGWEDEQVDGGKWSPVRVHRRSWPSGTKVAGPWGMKVSLLERLESIWRPVDVFVLLTFQGLEPGLPVRVDGNRALVTSGHATQQVVARSRLRV